MKKPVCLFVNEGRTKGERRESEGIFHRAILELLKNILFNHITFVLQTGLSYKLNPQEMKTPKKFFFLIILLIPIFARAELKEIPHSLDDRDRIIRTEQRVESMQSDMNSRFEQLFNFLWAIIGIFTTTMISVFGFAFWDRKLSLSPIKRDNDKLINALREYAKQQPKLMEVLKNAGLL